MCSFHLLPQLPINVYFVISLKNVHYFIYKACHKFLLRVCLFGGKIWWMKYFGKKMGRNFFLSVFGWVERKENKW